MSEQSASTDLSIGRASDHPHTRDWRQVYARRLVLTDFLVLVWVVFGVQIAWLGFDTAIARIPRKRQRLDGELSQPFRCS